MVDVSHLSCGPHDICLLHYHKMGTLKLGDPLAVPAAEAVLMRARGRRPSLALGTRSSSCATPALIGSSAVLPPDVRSSLPEAEAASTVPQVGANSHTSKTCQ